jgi:hypothetical protein
MHQGEKPLPCPARAKTAAAGSTRSSAAQARQNAAACRDCKPAGASRAQHSIHCTRRVSCTHSAGGQKEHCTCRAQQLPTSLAGARYEAQETSAPCAKTHPCWGVRLKSSCQTCKRGQAARARLGTLLQRTPLTLHSPQQCWRQTTWSRRHSFRSHGARG